MAWTRVVLAALPAMISDIVRETLAAHSDVQIVAEVESRTALRERLAATDAEIAIVGLAMGETPGEFAELLRAHPGLTVLAISLEDDMAYHCRMCMLVSVTPELSLQQLVDALRAREGVDRELHLISFHWPIAGAAPGRES
jgi:DNA-binding NarL/FixJ family response regulator